MDESVVECGPADRQAGDAMAAGGDPREQRFDAVILDREMPGVAKPLGAGGQIRGDRGGIAGIARRLRSAERRVGKSCVSTFIFRFSPFPYKKIFFYYYLF